MSVVDLVRPWVSAGRRAAKQGKFFGEAVEQKSGGPAAGQSVRSPARIKPQKYRPCPESATRGQPTGRGAHLKGRREQSLRFGFQAAPVGLALVMFAGVPGCCGRGRPRRLNVSLMSRPMEPN